MEIHRLSVLADFGTGIRNLPALLRWQLGCTAWLIRNRGEYDLIHACDFDTVLPALLMKVVWGVKVIYDIFDFYADHLRSTPVWIKKKIAFLEKRCIGWVDGVILVDESRWKQIEGARPRQSAVIYNTPLDLQIDPEKATITPHDGKFVLAYVGLLQRERGLFELLEVMKRHPEWRLALAGFGGDEATILETTSSMKNVDWHGRVPYQRAIQLSQKADVLYAAYDPGIPNHKYASPNKVFEAMMLDKPIVVARNTNIDQIVRKFDCGLVIHYGDVEELESALIKLFSDERLRLRLGKNARKAYESSYSWTKMETRLIDLYKAVLA